MTQEEREKHAKSVFLIAEQLGSKFFYEPLEGIDTLRSLLVFSTEQEFQDYLKSRHNRVFCASCNRGAEYVERTKNDKNYKRPVCIMCIEKAVVALYNSGLKRQKGDADCTYSITALEARAKAKGFVVVNQERKS